MDRLGRSVSSPCRYIKFGIQDFGRINNFPKENITKGALLYFYNTSSANCKTLAFRNFVVDRR